MSFVTSVVVITVTVVFASLTHSLPLGNTTQVGVTNTFGCEPGEIDDCSKCFDVLANEIISVDRNRYNLQRAFFPPDSSNPVFVQVTYYFTRNKTGNGSTDFSLTSPNQTWFWTQSSFYLFQPLESLQFTSLLFTDPSLREIRLSLYLQPHCINADIDMLELLTQRLKVYAMEQKVATRISDIYNAKGVSVGTLETLFNGENPVVREGKHLTRYTISFQVVFPILAIIFLGWLFHHVLENKKDNFVKDSRKYFQNNPDNSFQEGDKRKWKPDVSTRNMYIYISVFGSLSFVVYVFVLDCLAVGYRNARKLGDIFFQHGARQQFVNFTEFYFESEYSIPHLMLVYDFFIGLFVLVGLISLSCGVKKSWHYALLGPCACIIVHSYHILVGYIHAPYHATGILIFYGISVIVFVLTYRAAYYNLVHCFKRLKIQNPQQQGASNTGGVQQTEASCCCCTCILAVCCIEKHPPISKDLRYWQTICRCKSIQCCFLFAFLTLSLFLSLTMVFVVILFIIVPINHAIEDAPNRLLNINQSILVFIAAAATYKLYRTKKNDTILDQLVKANTRKLKDNAPPDPPGDGGDGEYKTWMRKNKSDKKTEIAVLLLDTLKKQQTNPQKNR